MDSPMSIRLLALAAAAALLPAVPASAENVVADIQRISTALQNAGYRAQIEGDGADRYIATGTGGTNFTIQMHGCNLLGGDCKNVMFYAWFDSDTPPTLEAMNTFAARARWGRFYIDHEGDPTIEMDVDLEDGGMSEELFIDNIEYWDSTLNLFASFVQTGALPGE
jgi:hypothetical protein